MDGVFFIYSSWIAYTLKKDGANYYQMLADALQPTKRHIQEDLKTGQRSVRIWNLVSFTYDTKTQKRQLEDLT